MSRKLLFVGLSSGGEYFLRYVCEKYNVKPDWIELQSKAGVVDCLVKASKADVIFTEWQSGYGRNSFIVLCHLFKAIFSKNSSRVAISLGLLRGCKVVVLPHGLNLYGTPSFPSNYCKFWQSRRLFDFYGVSTPAQILEAITYDIPISKIRCVGYWPSGVIRTEHKQNEQRRLFCHIPKGHRFNEEKFTDAIETLEKFFELFDQVLLLRHPRDNGIANFVKSHLPKQNVKIHASEEILKHDEHLDLGTSNFLKYLDGNGSVYRLNLTCFDALEFDECFESTLYGGVRKLNKILLEPKFQSDMKILDQAVEYYTR